MAAKITLLQEDINQLSVDAIVRGQYSQETDLARTSIVRLDRPTDAEWAANCELLMKANCDISRINVSSKKEALECIVSTYRQIFEFVSTTDIRSMAFNVLGGDGVSDETARAYLCISAIQQVNEASIAYSNLRKIIICSRNEQEYQCLVGALQALQLH